MSEWERRVVNEARTADRRRPRTWASGKRVLVPLGSVWLLGAIVVGLAATTDNPQILFFDPSFLSDHPAWYVGIISQLGVLGWAIAALSASWTAWFARHVGRPSAERFLRHGALATVVLLGDDLFGLHVVISDFLLVPKVVMQLLVIAPCGLWLVTFRRDIGRTRWPVLVAAVGHWRHRCSSND